MKKIILISVVVYLLAVTTLLVVTDEEKTDTLYNRTLQSSYNIDSEQLLEISSEFRSGDSYDLSEEELNDYAIGKVMVVESSSLTDTIEIYELDIYQDITENASIDLQGNTVLITSDLGPLSFYKCSTFLSFGQFDSGYFNRAPNRMYEVHIPEGTPYILE